MIKQCEKCKEKYETLDTVLYSKSKYCYQCRQELYHFNNIQKNRKTDSGYIEKHDRKKRDKSKLISKYIEKHLDWYNAGLFAGKQGELHDIFMDKVSQTGDFLLAKSETEKHDKWQAKIRGLSSEDKVAWLIGFMAGINGSKYNKVVDI